MSEEKGAYKTGNPEVDDAMEMLGKGYDAPLEIHPQTTVIRRKGWEMVEEIIPAFIKISTSFKSELKDISPFAFKVWGFLALSVNRNTEQAHPGIRTIARETNMAQNTVTKAIEELEKRGLLSVNREERKWNIYEFPAYVSANKKDCKTASPSEAVGKTASQEGKTASPEPQTASQLVRLNQRNQREPDNIKHTFQNSPTDSLGKHLDLLAEGQAKIKPYVDIIERLSAGLHLNLPPYGENKDVDRVAHMIALAEADHPDQTVELFCAWATATREAKELSWYRIRPDGIWQDWLLPYVPVKQKAKARPGKGTGVRDAEWFRKLAES